MALRGAVCSRRLAAAFLAMPGYTAGGASAPPPSRCARSVHLRGPIFQAQLLDWQPTRKAWKPPLRTCNAHATASPLPAKAPVVAFPDSVQGRHLPPTGAPVRQGPGPHSAAHATLPVLGRDNNATDAAAAQERCTACHVHGTNPKPSCQSAVVFSNEEAFVCFRKRHISVIRLATSEGDGQERGELGAVVGAVGMYAWRHIARSPLCG